MAKKKTPEGLDGLWDSETEAAWKKLNPKQQKFIQAYLKNGYNGTQAYRDSYNKLSTDNVAASCARQYLRSPHIVPFLDRLADSNKSDLIAAKKVYLDGMEAFKPVFGKDSEGQPELIEEIADHKIRRECADSLMKLNGEYIEKTDITHNFPKGIDINFVKSSEANPDEDKS